MHPIRRHDVRADGIDQRAHQPRGLAYPIREGGTIQFDAAARIDLGLAIQRAMIGILRHQHVRQQCRRGQAAVNGQAGSRGLHDTVAAAAGQLRTHVADDAEHCRHVIEHFGDILAQPVQRAAAFRTGAGCGMFHRLARQIFGKRPARRLAPSYIHWFGRGGLLRLCRRGLGDLFLEIAQDQFQLLDRGAQLLRRGTEPFA